MQRWAMGNAFADHFSMGAVPYVESPDTDLSPGQQIIFNKLMAYARTLLILHGRALVYYRDWSSEPGCYGLGRWLDNMVWCRKHLMGGQRVDRFVDDTVIASESLGFQVGMPGLLGVISSEPIEKRVIQVQTAFGANVRLHDYSGIAETQGLPGHAWTDSGGRVELHLPSNEFGKAQCYGAWSLDGVPNSPPPPQRSTRHSFIAARDLDVAPAYNGSQVVGRIWCAGNTALDCVLSVEIPLSGSIKIILSISDAAGGIVTIGPGGVMDPPNSTGEILTRQDGWVEFSLDSSGLPEGGAPFELAVRYTGMRGLAHV
jgi:alpha-amylase